MNVTYFGHSCFQVEVAGRFIVIDPFITGNEKAQHIQLEEIDADYILLTHGHGDHVMDTAAIAKRTGAMLISNFEVVSWFEKQGIDKYHPMNQGGKRDFEFGTVKYVNAVHSSTMPDGSPGGNPGGFVITSPEGTLYHSGDTALTYDMKLIGEFHKPRLAMLCIGDNFTMGYEDALIAAQYIQCDTIIGMHYDTFGYILLDHQKAKDTFSKAGKELILMEIGETRSF